MTTNCSDLTVRRLERQAKLGEKAEVIEPQD